MVMSFHQESKKSRSKIGKIVNKKYEVGRFDSFGMMVSYTEHKNCLCKSSAEKGIEQA